jgi:hypothetical protein
VDLGVLGLPREEARDALLAARPDHQIDLLHRPAWKPVGDRRSELLAREVARTCLDGRPHPGHDVAARVVPDGQREVPGSRDGGTDGLLERVASRAGEQPQVAAHVQPPTPGLHDLLLHHGLDQVEEVVELSARALANVVGGQHVDGCVIDPSGL